MNTARADIIRAVHHDMATVLETAMWNRLAAQREANRTGTQRVEPVNTAIWQQTIETLKSAVDGELAAAILAPPTLQPLTEWCERHRVNPRTARDWATANKLKTAHRRGTAWFIDTTELPPRKGKHHGKKH